jgi:hypothetical protein
MSDLSRRTGALLVGLVLLSALAACGGAAPSTVPSASPSPTSGPVVTEADAVERVIAHEPRLTGIQARDADLIGQSSWYEVAPASGVGAFVVRVYLGWGDCPAGCIDDHTWTYAVGPDGTVSLVSESGSSVPPDAWPSPSSGTSPETGMHISAVAGPTCPVETVPPDPACAARPVARATILIDDGAGSQATVVTDAAGQAFAALAPGTYTVTAQGTAGFMGGPEPQQVLVEDGSVTELVLTYDTGIR